MVSDMRPSKDMEMCVGKFKQLRPPLLKVITSNNSNSNIIDDNTISNKSNKLLGNTACRRIVTLDFHKLSREKVKNALEKITENCKIKLRLDGDKDVLEKRYREFVHLNNAQLLSGNAYTLEEVVQIITKRENARDMEAKKVKLLKVYYNVI